jgi:hypothetical protein
VRPGCYPVRGIASLWFDSTALRRRKQMDWKATILSVLATLMIVGFVILEATITKGKIFFGIFISFMAFFILGIILSFFYELFKRSDKT